MALWRVQQIEVRRSEVDYTSSGQGRLVVSQLFADGELIANALARTEWGASSVQAMVCAECGIEGCAAGGWISPRRSDGWVLWLPAFDEMAESARDAHDYRPPACFARGIPLFGKGVAAALRGLPALREPPALRTHELIRAMQWTAPARVFGTFPDDVRLRRDHVLAVSSGERETRLQELERLLEEGLRDTDGVTLRELEPNDESVVFWPDAPGHPAWSPLVLTDGKPTLHLDGLVCVIA
jgi:hypothetical protein